MGFPVFFPGEFFFLSSKNPPMCHPKGGLEGLGVDRWAEQLRQLPQNVFLVRAV